ncbi:acyl-CoA dehydrogenase family protein [Streptomyces sp. x-80]|uniref:acyl-CoA dehydrogenase family protein n=1 Tax=Streptomyces sp. x-80 TaxID=2789282 RepID=UPI00398044B3
MDELGRDRVAALRAYCAEAAVQLREIGPEIDHAPDRIAKWLELPAVHVLRACTVPDSYMDRPLRIGRHTYDMRSCLEHTVTWEALSYGDAGAVLASPGPSMSGVTVDALGNDAQRDWYFTRLGQAPTWTFFALTEPEKGSAAVELTATLTPDGDGFVLDGAKRYVGNGAHAQLGVAFCRRGPGPLGIEVVLVDTADPGFHAEVLPTVGLRGARITAMTFDRVRIPRERVLGLERKPTRRGLVGGIRTLLRFRPVLAGMALGLARSALDHVQEQRPALAGVPRLRLAELSDRVAAARAQTFRVAAEIDAGRLRPDHIAAVKLRAAELAEESTLLAADLMGQASLLEDPWLNKLYRDARAFEFKEGTGQIHRLGVFQGVLKGSFLPDDGGGGPC